MSKSFKFYFDLMSQPSRALWMAFRLGETPHELCPVALRKREQLSEEFKKINRFRKVPCIVDGDFHLAETVAIIRYLSAKGQFSEDLYSKDFLKRIRIDEFLEWQHLGLRAPCSLYFLHGWLLPMNGLAPPISEERKAKLLGEMESALKTVEALWLKDSSFLVGNKLTIADLLAACEIEQTRLLHFDPSKKFPKLTEWLANVRAEANPHYDEGHKFIYKKSNMYPTN